MLNEKGLAAAMKLAWRGSGYVAAIADETVMLKAGMWGVHCDIDVFPRKCLGLLAEHIGGLPDGVCYKLQKDLGAQTKILDDELGFWQEVDAGRTSDERHPVRPTQLELGGFWIWQDQGDLQVMQVDHEFIRIIDTDGLEAGAYLYAPINGLIFRGAEGTAIVIARGRVGANAMLERLDGFPWCGE